MIKANVEEDREATMMRFLNMLNREIANVVELQHYVELEDMVHMTMKVERQLKRKGGPKFGVATHLGSSTLWKLNWSKRDDKPVAKPREESHRPRESTSNKEKCIESQPKCNRYIKCFCCLGIGYIASQCPNKRAMVLHDDGEIKSKGEDDDNEFMLPLEDASDVEFAVDGETLIGRHALNMQIKEEDKRYNVIIFFIIDAI